MALAVSRPRSLVYVFTDATAGDHRRVGEVLDAVQRKQSQVVFVLTGHCNDLQKPSYQVYRQIAAASSGQVFNLNKTSVHKVLDFVRSSLRGRNVNLGSSVNPAGYNHTQAIPVDRTLGEVTVSVSGVKPQIKVVDPNGEVLKGPPKLITTLDLSEIMVVKVMQPEPGNWTITVGSEKDYSVKVVGLSNLTFNHGFSVSPPTGMQETSYRPLKSTYNHLMISLTETDAPVQVNFAEIQDLSGKTLFEVPLKEFDKARKTYLADPFIPPDDFFYIAINGHDESGQELRRIGATAVQSKTPDVPYLTAPQKIEARYHERVTLTCGVESLVPVTARWARGSDRLQPLVSSLQSTTIDYVIEDMSEDHVGTYRCIASNVAGTSTATTELELTVDPPQVTLRPGNISLQMGEQLKISCEVFSEASLVKMQLVFKAMDRDISDIFLKPNLDGYYTYNETIPHVDETHSGEYTCLAANRAGESKQSINVTVQTQPIVQILGPHSIKKPIHSSLQLTCHVENAERMQWVAPNGTVMMENTINGTYDGWYDVKNVTGGTWTCVGMRGDYRSTDIITVDVLIKPQARIEGSKNITVMNGTTHDITCFVTAKPAPRIIWHRETEDFLPHVITAVEDNVYKSVLKLNSSEEGAEATYFCIGENSEGIAEDSISVNLRRKMTLLEGFTDKSVEIYSQVDLHCQVDAYPPARLAWYHNGTELTTDSNVQLADDKTIMYVLMVDFDNLGLYTCEADNGYEKMIVNGTLSVKGLESPVVEKSPASLSVRRGESTILTCRVLEGKPDPVISWKFRKNSTTEFTDLPWGVELPDDGTNLTISDVTVRHDGVYRCVAENVVGRDEYDVQLVVQYPPELVEGTIETESYIKPIEVEMGNKTTLSCKAVGVPPPVVVWNKNRRPLSFTNNVYLTETNDLVIEKATEFDSGLYTCNVTSALGSTEKNFTVFVFARPSIAPPDVPPPDVVEGQLVQLPCRASGVPLPRVRWLHDGEDVDTARKYIDENSIIFIANVTDFGNFTCLVENDYGNDSVSYPLYVWVPPSVRPVVKSTEVLLGANVTLQCDATGFPIPFIMWEFQDELLTENGTNVSFNDVGNLMIRNASEAHEGTYACIAENIAGHDKKYINLRVFQPPSIIERDSLDTYVATNMDTKLVVSCSAAGKPKPYVLWAKDGVFLNNDSTYSLDFEGTLTIKSPTEKLSGLYVCVAKNAAGEVNKTISVEIYSMPTQMQSEDSQMKVPVVEGGNTSIECPIPASQKDLVKWYKDAKLISTGRLEITNVSRHNSSAYACVVTNMAGSATSSVIVDVEWPPRFAADVRDRDLEVIQGNDAYLDCGVDAKPVAKTKWLFNGAPMPFEDKDRLKLLNVEPRHAGQYQCVVTNNHGSVNRTYSLSVLVPPTIVSSPFYEKYVTLREGMNATLECNVIGSPEPSLQWSYKLIKTSPEGDTQVIKSEWLKEIGPNLTVSAEGDYRCEASNKAGEAALMFYVSKVAAPAVTDVLVYRGGEATTVLNNTEVVVGETIRISCAATGEPLPRIQWIRPGVSLKENEDDVYVDLTLSDVRPAHAGVYSCVATNEAGDDERKIRLDVLEPPTIFQPLSLDIANDTVYLEVLAGQSFSLHCHPDGNPAPEVYWFKDGLPLRLFDDSMVSSSYGEVISARAAAVEQAGNYTCVARNSVGNTSLVYLLDVLVPPPSPKGTAKPVTVRAGRPLTLTCPVEGSPLPDVMWVRHPYTEITEDTPRVTLLNNSYSLVINNTEVSDSGRYACVMTNRVGTTEVPFAVTVELPPTILGEGEGPERHVVPLMRSLVLPCEVEGHPPPKLTWLKDTQRLKEDQWNIQRVLGHSLLALWSARARDAGQYICVAENTAGTAHRRYDVAVKVPGKWSSWSGWSLCNATCGAGYQTRGRLCRYVDDDNVTYDKTTKSDRIILDESECKGQAMDKRKCHMPPCEEQRVSVWSAWLAWAPCSASCGAGSQARRRRCRAPPCHGHNVQIRKCPNLPTCEPSSEKREIESFSSSLEQTSNSKEVKDTDSYIPEATFEMQPENVHDNGFDAEEFYINSGLNSPDAYDVNVTSNLDFSDNGPCAVGFRHNDTEDTCDDIDECSIENNQCHATQLCLNTAGAYRCTCPPGYNSQGAGQRCLDVNECEVESDLCEFACVNVAGGYVCACPRPLRLHRDRTHCVTPSSYRQPLTHDRYEEEEYLSATFEFPSGHMKNTRN